MAEERFLTETKHQRFRPYPKYKDSGVEWLGEIPAHWIVKKIKRLCLVRRGASPRPIDDPIYFAEDGEYAWVRIADVTASDRYLEQTTQRLSPLGVSKSVLLEPGELFVSIAATVGKAIITKIKCCIHDGFVYFVGLRENRDYLYYLFSCGEAYKGIGKLGTQLNLNTDTIGDIYLPVPCPEEQSVITTFLDRETAKIDALVAKRERLIELLQEKRTALITQAVTKGLDPNVPMKDSGIEWLGIIPAHWGVKRLKYLSSINDEALSEKTDPRFELIYVDIGSVDQYQGIVEREELVFENAPSRARRIVKDGDVIISTVRTYLRAIAPIKNPDPNLIVSTGFSVIRPSSALEDNFAPYALRASHFVERVVANSVGVSYPAIDANKISCLSVAIPDIKEQQAIVSFLEREMTKIDALVTEIREAIDRLKEYRTALIAAAATGKIDVRSKVTR